MRFHSLLGLLAFLATGCQPDDRPDGGDPQHTGADDYEQDAAAAETGTEGADALPLAPEDTLGVREALGDEPVAE